MQNYGTELTLLNVYCELFYNTSHVKNTNELKKQLMDLNEQKIDDLKEFYQNLALKIDAELNRLDMVELPDDLEQNLKQQMEESNGANVEVMFELAKHLNGKNRHEEAIDLLLDVIAIDRNWNQRAAQKLINDIFKKLGAANELTIKKRKQLSKLLF